MSYSYTWCYIVITIMSYSLRWAVLRAILMFHSLWGAKPQDGVKKSQLLKRKESQSRESNTHCLLPSLMLHCQTKLAHTPKPWIWNRAVNLKPEDFQAPQMTLFYIYISDPAAERLRSSGLALDGWSWHPPFFTNLLHLGWWERCCWQELAPWTQARSCTLCTCILGHHMGHVVHHRRKRAIWSTLLMLMEDRCTKTWLHCHLRIMKMINLQKYNHYKCMHS